MSVWPFNALKLTPNLKAKTVRLLTSCDLRAENSRETTRTERHNFKGKTFKHHFLFRASISGTESESS